MPRLTNSVEKWPRRSRRCPGPWHGKELHLPMRDESNQEHFFDGYTERLVVLQLLGHRSGYPRARLLADLDDIEPQLVEQAIASLEQAGVVCVEGTRLHPSAALQRLDELTMICI